MDDKTYALIESTGSVINTIIWDGTTPYQPDEGCLVMLIPEGVSASIGWTYEGGAFIAPPVPPTPPLMPEQILAANTAKRNQLLDAAMLAIGPLQNAADIGEPKEAESAMLMAWKQFSVTVNRVDLTQVNPAWPSAPQAGYGAAVIP